MSGRLRIAHMIGSLAIGGAERQVVNLLNELPAGNAVVITLTKPDGGLAASLHKDVAVLHFRARRRSLPLDVLWIAYKLRKLKVDVLQTHMFWPNLVGSLAGKLAGIKVVVTTEHGRNEWKPRWARLMERHVISRLADKRICVSNDIREMRIAVDKIPADKLCVIPNGTALRRQVAFRDESPLLVGTLGRLIEAKDYPSLLSAAALLKERGVPCRFVIVGDGPERERLANEIQARGLDSFVDLPGSSTDAQSWLERFDIYVISSIREGQPLSLLEAMANGLPIVATRVGGIPRTIEDGVEALLVPPRDPEGMASAIEQLANDPARRKRLGLAARERQTRDFSVGASLRKHTEVYTALLDRKIGYSRAKGSMK